jgi:Na+-transporting NADH:ubiquinone oxidoreductase subunit C
MDKNSNAYTFIYASVMVILVAIILSSVSGALKPYQQKNREMEKMQNILSSIGVFVSPEQSIDKYKELVKEEIVVNPKGEVLSIYSNGKFEKGDTRAFDINLKEEYGKIDKGEEGMLPIYEIEDQGKTYYVIPVRGKGLWGPIWGNIALESDFNTIYGANFDHEGETPGLGAEIADKPAPGKVVFSDQFKGKKIFDDNGEFVSVTVVKGGVKNQSKVKPQNGVDAISGSTLTCNGVTEMLRHSLGLYVEYFKNHK